MPRTVDHIVETHRIAGERRKAGKPIWAERIRIRPATADEPFTEVRDRFKDAVVASRWYRGCEYGDELHELVDELKDAEDMRHVSLVIDAIYDAADFDRVWIGS